ncbi:class I SAM-dependent methyltransferase [Humibacter ginsenosidimutans]|uniref:Methyltransferase domain-containing protein n=1 Tax=Humibacter ginsenosidimutans TaxID=2599293 RepID=A0A5B8M382_9MICO|nr:class I SAM-dependent methyltransferase [Humibacter ginsenosidimutans]QDZ15057.1 methyltransferase domain-containing protein [Humibacter ginsenosidimutans]
MTSSVSSASLVDRKLVVKSQGAPTGTDLYAADSVRQLFDRMSRTYERVNVVLSLGFSARWRRQLARLAPMQRRGASILDAMCGMGETWDVLTRRFADARFSALDFSPQMTGRARVRNLSRHAGRFAVLERDMLASGLPDASFDLVISAYGVKTFDQEQSVRFADELARILRPGGTFAFIEVTEPPSLLLRMLYGLYIGTIVPALARLLVADTEQYRMLGRYLRAYGDGRRTLDALAGHPLLVVEARKHFFGCATSFSGYRLAQAARP